MFLVIAFVESGVLRRNHNLTMMMVMELGSWVMVPNFGAYILIGMMFVELLEVWIFRKTASLVEDFKYHKTTTEK